MMKTRDLASSLFWLVVSISVFIESLRLGVGSPQNPGMGFWALGASGVLGILSISLLLGAVFGKEETQVPSLFSGRLWKRVVLILIALLIYAKFMPVIGFLVSTFVLMVFLFWTDRRQKWWRVAVVSIVVTLGTYLVFSVWLKVQFPEGLFPVYRF